MHLCLAEVLQLLFLVVVVVVTCKAGHQCCIPFHHSTFLVY